MPPFDVASPHDPVQLPLQLAELIGQLQHLIDLAEAQAGRSAYDPLIVDLSTALSQTINLPAEAHQLEALQLSSDTAVTVTVYRIDQQSGPSGKLIAQVRLPAGAVAAPILLNCPVPPTAAQLKLVTSVAVANGAAMLTLARLRPGGYPYAS